MKKIRTITLATIMALLMVFTLIACADDTPSTTIVLTPPPDVATDPTPTPAPEATPEPEPQGGNDTEPTNNGGDTATDLSTATVGDVVLFGGIDWRVLDIQGGRALLLSDRILEERAFDPATAWDTSEIRTWLNGEFYNDTFTPEERGRIVETTIPNPVWLWGTGPMVLPDTVFEIDDTTDKIFLLSLEEVLQYFGDSGTVHRGVHPNDQIRMYRVSDQYDGARTARNTDGAADSWWLRTRLYNKNAFILQTGEFAMRAGVEPLPQPETAGVRPAMWVELG